MNTLYNNKYDILASTIQPNPASVKYWADLSSNSNGGDLKYYKDGKWVLVNDKATEVIPQIKQQIADLEQKKVDKIEGKKLSTEDYTTQDKNKLAGLQNYNDTEVRNLISALQKNKVDKDGSKVLSDNNYTTDDKNKLKGLSNYNDKDVKALIATLTTRVDTLEKNYSTLKERVDKLEKPTA